VACKKTIEPVEAHGCEEAFSSKAISMKIEMPMMNQEM
jgi:hypothetical protein